MPSFPRTLSSRRNSPLARAGTACRGRVAPPPGPVHFLTRSCGLSLPALFKTIGTRATDGQPARTTPTIASRPAERHDNRIPMTLANPFSRPVTHRPIERESIGACAGPFTRRQASHRSNLGEADEFLRSQGASK